jgi:spermidine synthase
MSQLHTIVARRTGAWASRAAAALAFGFLALLMPGGSRTSGQERVYGTGAVEFETTSDFSRIRIRRQGSVRTLFFVGESGDEVVESAVNIAAPHELLVPYTRFMFASYLFRPEQSRVLIVGLGGGSMIHFLKHYHPQLQVDVVEIDPAIVKTAEDFFGIRSEGNVKVITADGFQYLRDPGTRYDVLYMDAFLRPREETDSSGTPRRLKTIEFLKEMQLRLLPDGLVVFNLHSQTVDADTQAIQSAFPQVYSIPVPGRGNRIVVGTLSPQRQSTRALAQRARELDRRFQTPFSFREFVDNLVP